MKKLLTGITAATLLFAFSAVSFANTPDDQANANYRHHGQGHANATHHADGHYVSEHPDRQYNNN